MKHERSITDKLNHQLHHGKNLKTPNYINFITSVILQNLIVNLKADVYIHVLCILYNFSARITGINKLGKAMEQKVNSYLISLPQMTI